MIEYNRQKYRVRDENYSTECQKILSEIESLYARDSIFGYRNSGNLITGLKVIIERNNEDYNKYYVSNLKRFEILKERISWDFVEPYSDFEKDVKLIMKEAESCLEAINYSENKKSSELIEKAEELLNKYIKETKLIDSVLRRQINSRISKLKTIFSDGSLFSLKLSDKIFRELELLIETNLKKHEGSYRKLVQKIDILHRAFEKSAEFFSPKEKKEIQEQFAEIEKIMNSQSYEKFEDARDLLDVIDVKLSDIAVHKEKIISGNLKKKLKSLRTRIWLEDWDDVNDAVKSLLEQANRTGTLYNLNLDKFNTDQMEVQKKKDIFDFKMIVKAKNYSNASVLLQKADSMISGEFYKSDFEELKRSVVKGRILGSKSKSTDKDVPGKKKSSVKLIFYSLMFVAILVLFIYNNRARTEHDQNTALKYLDVIETMVYSQKRQNRPVEKEEIMTRINFPTGDMEILSISESEIVISYGGREYRKKVRSAN